MKNIDTFHAQYLPATGGIEWPSTGAGREELARLVFGLGFVEAHDSWIARSKVILDPGGAPFAPAFARETMLRQQLAKLAPNERDAVIDLVRIAVHGALFSALVSLDQFPRAELVIQVRDENAGADPITVAPGKEDLHDAFFAWLEEYSSESSAEL